jgi:hypothetical protein
MRSKAGKDACVEPGSFLNDVVLSVSDYHQLSLSGVGR